MSKAAADSASSDQLSWGVWQGFQAFRTDSATESIPVLKRDRETIRSAGNESDRVLKALAFSNSGRKKCRVPGCRSANCKLITHQLYKPRGSTGVKRKYRSGAHSTSRQLDLFIKPLEPLRDAVDGFPQLPIEESSDPRIRSLFHHFFCTVFDQLSVLFRGPAVTKPADFKGRMLGTALSSEAYCRCLILMAQTLQNPANNQSDESQKALSLYDNTLKAFRDQLQSIYEKPNPIQIELALLVLCSLMMHDGAHYRHEASRLHWQCLKNLVTLRGGMHCVTTALPYIIHADRSYAFLFNEPPTFTNVLRPELPMPIPVPSPLRYGLKFEDLKDDGRTVQDDVVDHCIEVSGLVELWEESQARAITRQRGKVVYSMEYLHFARDRLDERFAVLNAQWSGIGSRDRCLLWATRIVEYTCTWSNFEHTVTAKLGNQLVCALQEPDAVASWHQDVDTFIWMLFTLATVDLASEVQAWVISSLHRTLNIKYEFGPWPRVWWIDEQENLLGFAWSSPRYAGLFKKICDKLELLNRES